MEGREPGERGGGSATARPAASTRGLNMEYTRLTQPRKLDTLLVIITLAMAWAYGCATAVKGTRSIKTGAHG